MTNLKRAGLAGIIAIALAGSALAQTAPVAPAGAPTATDPAATETPKTPAASGGDASDATASGQPAGSAAPADASGGAMAPAAGAATAEKTFPIPRAGDTAQQVELITGLCGVQMKDMKPESCKCLAEQSLTNLSDPQRDYLIATVVSPPAADRMLADGRVGQPDQQVISSFIDKTADACSTGTYKPAP
ncbi:hypothetical protein ASG43_10730 [Aureimonas sp. Leaf454]|uniref:hypothetical protein n=1 Tax=Aureimonas sp. Leaf454 TaxID=1736381 RepID=UPI0006FF409D|nr:hypothetical protein [Aureimonas sp. Leaf454]KQT47548.1 hypothetical protein ASG43_10730 [Aureimonas sp. Leaf454]